MTRKKIICNWLLTIIFSYIIFGLIHVFVHWLSVLFIIVWTVSYTVFYFIRNRKVLFQRSE